jgi:hypothetical protein
MQLVRSIFSFQLISQAKQTKLLFNSVQPLIGLQWFLRLLKERGLSIKKVLEITILIGFGALAAMTSLPVGKLVHSICQHTLPFDHGLHQISRGRWWRRGWLFLILIATTLTEIVRHLQNS